jgi:hypothetical protein
MGLQRNPVNVDQILGHYLRSICLILRMKDGCIINMFTVPQTRVFFSCQVHSYFCINVLFSTYIETKSLYFGINC